MELVGKRFQVEGKIFTVYSVVANGVFAHEGDVMETNEKGEVLNPRYFDYEQVEPNLVTPGRPSIGKTKRVSITLTEDQWDYVHDYIEPANVSLSKYFRDLVEKDIQENEAEGKKYEEEEKE